MIFFKASFRAGAWVFFSLFDEKGRLLHLSFGKEPAPRLLKRFKRFFPGACLREDLPAFHIQRLQEILEAYFSRRLKELSFPCLLWGSPFEKRVWEAVSDIPYGEVRTYRWVAERIGNPQAVRAVGRALASNPLPIFIPCHRVVACQSLGGFSQGLEIKKTLLRLEGAFRQ